MPLTASAPQAGDLVAGKYILRECLGEGGMGRVFLAEQISLARPVAIKLLQPALATCDALVRQLHTEAIAACRVKHPGAVAVIDCGTTPDGAPYIVMEQVPGRLLSAVIDDEEIPLARAFGIVQQLLCTLKAAHAQRVIHADIKSDNVMIDVDPTSAADTVTLIDFGLARVDGRWEPGDVVSGTPEYMAPELARGESPTVATDLYGVGVILYELLTGQTPFAGGTPEEILRCQLEAEVIPPSRQRPDREIPALLDQIVLRALAKDPRRRFASAVELSRALTDVRNADARPARRSAATSAAHPAASAAAHPAASAAAHPVASAAAYPVASWAAHPAAAPVHAPAVRAPDRSAHAPAARAAGRAVTLPRTSPRGRPQPQLRPSI
jgi:serine/threonine-protein kinase